MALRQPLALNNATTTERPPADIFRLYTDALLGSDVSATNAGVVGAGSLKVTQHAGTPNNTVDIAAGHVFCESTEGSSYGSYYAYNDAVVSIAVTTGNATNPRKDLVIVEVEDSAEAGTPDDAHFVVVAGTAAASPAEPDLQSLGYDNYSVLALVDVPALDTVITDSQITDRRTAAASWAHGRGQVAYAPAQNTTGIGAGPSPLTGFSFTVTTVAGRTYRLSINATGLVNTGTSGWQVHALRDGSDFGRLCVAEAPAAGRTNVNGAIRDQPTAGSHTYTVAATRYGGAGTLDIQASGGIGGFLLLEDIGGYVV